MQVRFRTFAFLFSLFLPFAARTQDTAGNISGMVRDASGAAVPGAEVAAVHSETGARRTVRADGQGSYAIQNLPIGEYQLTVQHSGFKKAVEKNIALHVSDHLVIDFSLEIGELAQQVTVSESSEQVQVESPEQGGLISGEQVRELQLNGRSFTTLLELLPGVASNMPDRTDPNTNADVSINGGRALSMSFSIDGADNSGMIGGTNVLNTYTSVETIAEFKVMTSTFSAEYGRSGFSQINVVSKSGTRSYHGSLFEFLRNDALDARDYFSHQVLPLKLNNFGYTLGGPVRLPWYNKARTKTFFFWSQEFSRLSARGEAINTTVPTPAERRGDFSASGAGKDGQFGTTDDPVVDPATGRGFPGGIIPASRINRDGAKLLSLYPDPNFRGPGAINYTSALPGHQNWRQDTLRIDHNFTDSWRIMARMVQDSAPIENPYGGSLPTIASADFPGIANSEATRIGHNVTLNMTNILRPSLLNQFSVTRTGKSTKQRTVASVANRAQLGINIPELFPENDGDLIPVINLGSNYASLNIPRVTDRRVYNWEIVDNLSKTAGRHVLKAGLLLSKGANREQQTAQTNGGFTFTTAYSKNSIANLLLGLPATYTEAEHAIVSRIRFAAVEAFVQDDFRVLPRLTLSYGLRYSTYFNPFDAEDALTNFLPGLYDPARALQINPKDGRPIIGSGDPLDGIIVAGRNSPFGRKVTQDNTNLFAPRVGFAYDLFGDKKTSLRGGFGIYYSRPLLGMFVNNAWGNPPISRSVTLQDPTLNNPGGGSEAPAAVAALTSLGTPLLAPRIHQWSLGIQRETFQRALLSVSYVGSHGVHLVRPRDINSAPAGLATQLGVNVNAVRPYSGFGGINQRESTGSSLYHSLQVSLNRRMSRGLSFGLAYTFSKSIDDGSSDRGTGDLPPNCYNLRAERGLSSFDRSHILTSNFIWSLPNPVKKGHRTGALALNGWQLSGIARLYTGQPINIIMSQDVAGIGAVRNQRPNLIAGPKGPRTVEQWFNIYAFGRPASGTFGNFGRNVLRGPGVNKWDFALFKNFSLIESVRLQFRSEFFNAFNHPSFTDMGLTLNTVAAGVRPELNSFGVITATRDARVLQFALRLSF